MAVEAGQDKSAIADDPGANPGPFGGRSARSRSPVLRAFRGLALGLALSVANLAGIFLTLIAIGGLGEWSPTQFVGVFGIFEIATGAAFVVCPNVWRLPVAEADTPDRMRIRLALDTATTPHWAAGVKIVAGAAMVAYVGVAEGLGLISLGVLPFVAMVAVFIVAVSVIAARWGVARPDLDVVWLVIRRPGQADRQLPGISMTASVLQIVLGALTLPAIKVLSPSALYAPAIGPSPPLLTMTAAATIMSVGIAAWSWRSRLAWRAELPQREAEEAL